MIGAAAKAWVRDAAHRLTREEEGLALTEYLVALSIIVTAVLAAVTAFGEGLGGAWQSWGTWISTNVPRPPG